MPTLPDPIALLLACHDLVKALARLCACFDPDRGEDDRADLSALQDAAEARARAEAAIAIVEAGNATAH